MPRHSSFTQEIANTICERLSEGEPMASICRDKAMPGVTTVWEWTKSDETFSESIARARDAGFDAIATRARETARGRGDSTDDVPRDKLIIETDLKLLSKWDPRRYGDKTTTEQTGAGGGPLVILTGVPRTEGAIVSGPAVKRIAND